MRRGKRKKEQKKTEESGRERGAVTREKGKRHAVTVTCYLYMNLHDY